jgi:hypothetical protein
MINVTLFYAIGYMPFFSPLLPMGEEAACPTAIAGGGDEGLLLPTTPYRYRCN